MHSPPYIRRKKDKGDKDGQNNQDMAEIYENTKHPASVGFQESAMMSQDSSSQLQISEDDPNRVSQYQKQQMQ